MIHVTKLLIITLCSFALYSTYLPAQERNEDQEGQKCNSERGVLTWVSKQRSDPTLECVQLPHIKEGRSCLNGKGIWTRISSKGGKAKLACLKTQYGCGKKAGKSCKGNRSWQTVFTTRGAVGAQGVACKCLPGK